jgi:hypothetical protein
MSGFKPSTIALCSLARVLEKMNFRYFYDGLMQFINDEDIPFKLAEVSHCKDMLYELEINSRP